MFQYILFGPTRQRAQVLQIFTAGLLCLLSGCLIPDEFNLEVTANSATEVSWTFDGKWQLFLAGYDPRKQDIPNKDLLKFTDDLRNLPGNTAVAHVGRNIWKQSIAWQVRLQNSDQQPVPVLFPTGKQPSGGPDYWLLKITPESAQSVLVETVAPPTGQMLKDFLAMGYRSNGTFNLNRPVLWSR